MKMRRMENFYTNKREEVTPFYLIYIQDMHFYVSLQFTVAPFDGKWLKCKVPSSAEIILDYLPVE